MESNFPEGDWRTFRALREKALDRFCATVLGDIAETSEIPNLSAHDRYLKIYDLVQRRNELMASMFDNPRRSTALFQLALMYRDGLLSSDELVAFSEATRSRLRSLVETQR